MKEKGSLINTGRESDRLERISEAYKFLQQLSIPALQEVVISGHVLRPGSGVRLKPRGADILDTSLKGRLGFIESIEEDDRG